MMRKGVQGKRGGLCYCKELAHKGKEMTMNGVIVEMGEEVWGFKEEGLT